MAQRRKVPQSTGNLQKFTGESGQRGVCRGVWEQGQAPTRSRHPQDAWFGFYGDSVELCFQYLVGLNRMEMQKELFHLMVGVIDPGTKSPLSPWSPGDAM